MGYVKARLDVLELKEIDKEWPMSAIARNDRCQQARGVAGISKREESQASTNRRRRRQQERLDQATQQQTKYRANRRAEESPALEFPVSATKSLACFSERERRVDLVGRGRGKRGREEKETCFSDSSIRNPKARSF